MDIQSLMRILLNMDENQTKKSSVVSKHFDRLDPSAENEIIAQDRGTQILESMVLETEVSEIEDTIKEIALDIGIDYSPDIHNAQHLSHSYLSKNFSKEEMSLSYLIKPKSVDYEYIFSYLWDNPDKEKRGTTEYFEWSLNKNTEERHKERSDLGVDRIEKMITVKKFVENRSAVYSDIYIATTTDIDWNEIEKYNILKRLSFFWALTSAKYSLGN
ncbi:hypothetical protein K9M79_08285 [Candidatus Woesearchaeota archaeon]|nr:hypothetical protein [Candidatus Woesearchaeota archaeon]